VGIVTGPLHRAAKFSGKRAQLSHGEKTSRWTFPRGQYHGLLFVLAAWFFLESTSR